MDISAIKKIMKERKITQEKLSELSHLPISTIKKIMSGHIVNPRIDTINAIIDALDLNEVPAPNYPLLNALEKAGINAEDIEKLTEEQTVLIRGLVANFLKNKDKK